MRCALVLISFAALVGIFRIQVSGAPGSTVVPSHGSPANLAGILKTQIVVVGLQMWESQQRFPSLALVPGVICRPFRLRLFVVRAAGDKPLLCIEPPTPCVPSCWLRPRSPPACACVIPDWPATYSGPKIASSSAAARHVLPGRRAFADICSRVC